MAEGPIEQPSSLPSIETMESVVAHAQMMRTNPDAWLASMQTHLNNGDITPQQLRWAAEKWNHAPTDLIDTASRNFPKAEALFTYLKRDAVKKSFLNDGLLSRVKKWPFQFSLDGLSPGGERMFFHAVDMTNARISMLTSEDGETIPLTANMVSDSPVEWEQSTTAIGVCAEAEKYYVDLFLRRSGRSRKLPFDGVLFTDRGATIACMKFDGNDSVVGLRHVKSINGTMQMHKGMIYALSNNLYSLIRQRAEWIKTQNLDSESELLDSFLTVDIADLAAYCKDRKIKFGKNGVRFLADTPNEVDLEDDDQPRIYELMDSFVAKAESGKLRTLPLFEAT